MTTLEKLMTEMRFVLTEKKPNEDRKRAPQTEIDRESEMKDYACIYDFLENKQKFEPALSRLSALMWSHYRMMTLQDSQAPLGKSIPTGNLFTRALGLVAHQHGFTFQQGLAAETDFNTVPISVKLTKSDPYIGYLIRHKLFWKDVIATDHGEHSHSLQWLVLARELSGRTTSVISDLYARTVDYYAFKDEVLGVNLWQFLVDCFPLDGGGTRDAAGSLLTDSYRAPNNVTRHLIGYANNLKPLKGHFISDYFCRRYKKRGWVELKGSSVNFKAFEQSEGNADWVRGTTKFNEARLKRTGLAHDNAFSSRVGHEVVYHQAPGKLYMSD
ncbi:hypothetical protein KZJ38_25185 [Paraburkholderia edwinii]|uniref:DUF5636 domain-containing protein n=1 Tax=Paraburkholderia edwinii TaxID=2861782 RepID=A0ABX8UVE2_9BURK|nr:LirA/MavJ family T4SS effector [Paraburkholderia edwinii]QYD72975.1 hypothetical protein KZJ38_25185 [Paraburkholderia edwinii]